jgi:hypothetical protein
MAINLELYSKASNVCDDLIFVAKISFLNARLIFSFCQWIQSSFLPIVCYAFHEVVKSALNIISLVYQRIIKTCSAILVSSHILKTILESSNVQQISIYLANSVLWTAYMQGFKPTY